VISTADLDKDSLVAKVKASPGLVGLDMVKHVTCNESYYWEEGKTAATAEEEEPESVKSQLEFDFTHPAPPMEAELPPFRVVAMDCGIKFNILRELHAHGCDITVVPATATAEDIMALEPEGIFLSNGPGDPEGVPYVIDTVKALIGKKPIFGICLGHQILGLAFGGKSYKLKFGHRGANQPVRNIMTDRVEITTQNHGFCIDFDSIKDKRVKLTHVNLNDNTFEGMEHEEYQIFSVQYHPEASPGPHDASYLFDKFISMMKAAREKSPATSPV
jgi:carbamoyl-phosphate synthase small subunit